MLVLYQILCSLLETQALDKWLPTLKTRTAAFRPAYLANGKAVEVHQLIPLAAATAAAPCLQPHVHQRVMCV